MFLEVWQAAVNFNDWEELRRGCPEARERIKRELDGQELYMHALSVGPEYIAVSVKKLAELHIVTGIKLECK